MHRADPRFELVVVKGIAPAKKLGFARPPLNTTSDGRSPVLPKKHTAV